MRTRRLHLTPGLLLVACDGGEGFGQILKQEYDMTKGWLAMNGSYQIAVSESTQGI